MIVHDCETKTDILIEIVLEKKDQGVSILQVWRREFETHEQITAICLSPKFQLGGVSLGIDDCYLKLHSKNKDLIVYYLFGGKENFFEVFQLAI
jgi:cell fate regulator YaaT (PSP1 superfamily)